MSKAGRFLEQIIEQEIKQFVDLARKYNDVDEFIRKTDGMDVLYRGHSGNVETHNVFMTDYVGHAANYADEGRIDAYICNPEDVLYYDDAQFEELRNTYNLSDKQLKPIYQAALANNRFASQLIDQFSTVKKLLRSNIPYSDFCSNYSDNDSLVPLLLKYARDVHGKDIIAFHGGDYSEYGGQTEFVVGDVTKLVDLRQLYASVHGKRSE